ncbi:MAG: SRPBCC family protein [Burkholderiaceae bacterium]
MNLVNEFVIGAPRADVWAGLTNPEVAVACMPGAELRALLGDQKFRASVTLKVGPVRLQFQGEGMLVNLSPDQSYGELVAKGTDEKGRGGFKVEMKFTLAQETVAQTHVRVETLLSLTGSVAQYGRGVGIVKEIAGQLTSDFTRNLEAKVINSSLAQPDALSSNVSLAANYSETHAKTAEPSINVLGLFWRSLSRWLRSFFAKKA